MSSKLTNANLWKTSLGVIVITIIIIFTTETDWFMNLISYSENNNEYYSLWIKFGLQNLSFFFMGLATINLLWELYSKRNFTDEILEKVKLSKDINNSGIKKIYKKFGSIENIEWEELLAVNAKFFKFFFSSSTAWIITYQKNIEELNYKKTYRSVYAKF